MAKQKLQDEQAVAKAAPAVKAAEPVPTPPDPREPVYWTSRPKGSVAERDLIERSRRNIPLPAGNLARSHTRITDYVVLHLPRDESHPAGPGIIKRVYLFDGCSRMIATSDERMVADFMDIMKIVGSPPWTSPVAVQYYTESLGKRRIARLRLGEVKPDDDDEQAAKDADWSERTSQTRK